LVEHFLAKEDVTSSSLVTRSNNNNNMTIRTSTIAEFSDVLEVARDLGYDWNAAHDFLAQDILPWPEASSREHYLSEIDDYKWSEDSKKVMRAFFETHEITAFELTR
jgi:hypothetical protein